MAAEDGAVRLAFSVGAPLWLAADGSTVAVRPADAAPRVALRDASGRPDWSPLLGSELLEAHPERHGVPGTLLLRFRAGSIRVAARDGMLEVGPTP